MLDATAIARWRVPIGMTAVVHEFASQQNGAFRVSLTYETADGVGKTDMRTDTYRGHFVELVENEKVVEVIEFETTDPTMRGQMRVTTILTDADGGTDVVVIHDGIPPGVSLADNETGTGMALANLATLLEPGSLG
jgi:uncharacterized protein YndB with AHSA1/START domain